jgi:hypothetical protein
MVDPGIPAGSLLYAGARPAGGPNVASPRRHDSKTMAEKVGNLSLRTEPEWWMIDA